MAISTTTHLAPLGFGPEPEWMGICRVRFAEAMDFRIVMDRNGIDDLWAVGNSGCTHLECPKCRRKVILVGNVPAEHQIVRQSLCPICSHGVAPAALDASFKVLINMFDSPEVKRPQSKRRYKRIGGRLLPMQRR